MSKLNAVIAVSKAMLFQLFPRRKSRGKADVDVIILASEAIGDNLVFLDVLHFIENINASENKQTIFICNKKMQPFWEDNKELKTTAILPVDKEFSKETTKNIAIVKRMRIGNVILPMHHTLSVIIATSLRSNWLYAMLYNEWFVNRPFYIKKLYSSSNIQIVRIEDGCFIGSAYEKLVHKIYGKEYSWGLPKLQFDKTPVKYSDYIFIAPFSNLPERSLNEKQILDIIRFVLNKKHTVILSGTKNDLKMADRISEKIDNDHLINLVGKTSFEEYLNLIANSRIVIGTDSGSIHFAASFGIKSVVMAGLWSGAFLPYTTNKYNEYPKCIYTRDEMNCKYCLNKSGGIRVSNHNCYENIKNGNKRICLETIDIVDAEKVILDSMREDED